MAQDMGRGIVAPQATDPISSTGVQEMRTIASTAANAIGQAEASAVSQAQSYADERFWRRMSAPPGTDWDTMRTPGVYDVSTANASTMTGLPEQRGCTVEVIGSGGNTARMSQRVVYYGSTGARTYERSSAATSRYDYWVLKSGNEGSLSSDADLNAVISPWAHVANPDQHTIANMPPGAGPGLLHTVFAKFWTDMRAQDYFEYSGFGGAGRRWYRTGAGSGGWGQWRQVDGGGGTGQTGVDAGLANRLRIDAMSQRLGGKKKTDGKSVFSFRFDHGLKNFNEKIRPLFEAREIPYTLTLSSRHWDHAENAGVTPEMVNSWVEGGLCTVTNHGANAHQDASDYEELYDQIVNGLNELRDQIPAADIDMFMMPGVGGTNYGGFAPANTPESLYKTIGGQLCLEHHAVVTGLTPDTQYRVLDGTVRQGLNHVNMDSASMSAINNRITNTIAGTYGLQLSMHPSRIDEGDYLTTAQLAQVLDTVIARRDAGECLIMSSYDLALADAT